MILMKIWLILELLVLIFAFVHVRSIHFNCWDESEQRQLTFANNPNKTIDGFPTVRLLQGYYGSQWAAQYTAYLYLKEQLGVNVSFYPSDEHFILYDPDFDRPDYPNYYFQWIMEDKADLLMEVWHTVIEDAGTYV